MAKYRLLAEHVAPDGQVLPAGTEVGDDTPYPWPMDPSNQMEGIDDDGKKRVDDFWKTHYGHEFRHPDANPNLTDDQRAALEADEEAKKKEEEARKAGPPVSDQQRMEREEEGKPTEAVPPGPARQPSSTATASPTRGGVRASSPGPATIETRREDIRPHRPNEEQSPKDG